MDVEGGMPVNMEQYDAEAEEDDHVQQMDEASEDAPEDLDIEILDAPLAVFQTPRRKKTLKVKEKLDDSFLGGSPTICRASRMQEC